MTYAEAWDIYCNAPLDDPRYEAAAEHVRIADYDYQAGIISDVNEYDTTMKGDTHE